MIPFCNEDWSSEEKKKLNEAIISAMNLEEPICVEKLEKMFPNKPMHQIRDQYAQFYVDKLCIESGWYERKPNSYIDIEMMQSDNFGLPLMEKGKQLETIVSSIASEPLKKKKMVVVEKEVISTKGKPWTEEEHRFVILSLDYKSSTYISFPSPNLGLKMYGRGDWRKISSTFVTTRTPSQVASHAQKYYNRVKNHNEKCRASIHDIRLVEDRYPQARIGPSMSMYGRLLRNPAPGNNFGAATSKYGNMLMNHSSGNNNPSVNANKYCGLLRKPVYGNTIGATTNNCRKPTSVHYFTTLA